MKELVAGSLGRAVTVFQQFAQFRDTGSCCGLTGCYLVSGVAERSDSRCQWYVCLGAPAFSNPTGSVDGGGESFHPGAQTLVSVQRTVDKMCVLSEIDRVKSGR